MKIRQIDITMEDVRCCDELVVCRNRIEAIYELWFDVDKYFGTKIKGNENKWINFYTDWYIDGTIKASYELCDSEYGTQSFDWELTDEEKEFFTKKMEDYCQHYDGMSLMELWEKYNK